MQGESEDSAQPISTATGNEDDWVDPDDLIDDRSLTSAEDDSFRLEDVVEEVAALCSSASAPATVALYGSWGSGKSSLGNLLSARLASNKKIAFARFDAFKYAEVPLRRHFLSQVADAFGIKGKRFKEDLYASRRKVGVSLPKEDLGRFALIVLIAVVVTTVLALIAAAGIALVSKGGLHAFHRNFTAALRASLPGIALATPLLAVAVALVGKYLSAETTIEAPSSEEQFEELFKELVGKVKSEKKCERLVVFIDELDRCSPRQVVSALETLRTFLEVDDCVFVVAADQQVLEHALNDAARQATPFNPANPYYSAGSAYLDKIFQYQLQLPPVLPRRLSRYALDLIENRQGIWVKVANRAELVSVLVPTHVRSPRRVKVLLNAFALLYRLALRRAREELIEANVESRVAEIAKLACLRTEFPLFATDFQLDARLPELVLQIYQELSTGSPRSSDAEWKQAFPGISDEALVRGRAYAEERLPVDEVIARQPRLSLAQRLGSAQPQTAAAQPPQTPPASPADGSGADQEPEAPDAQVETSHARQLIRYLQRTERIEGPGRDLIYLESAGAAFGLPGELAQTVEEAAIEGRGAGVAEHMERLSDVEDQLKVFRLLARLVVESVGIETQNAVGALFSAMAATDVDLDPVADDLLNSLATYSSGYPLEPEDLLPALRLALSRTSPAATGMRRTVLGRTELLEDDELAVCALEHLQQLRRHGARLAAAVRVMLERGSGDKAERALRGSPESEVNRLLDQVTLDDDESVAGLATLIASAKSTGREDVAAHGLKLLLDSDEAAAADAARSMISEFQPVTDGELAAGILSCGLARPVAEWREWLAVVDADAAQQADDASATIDSGVERLWEERFPGQVTDEDFAAVAEELGRLRPQSAEEKEEELDLLQHVPAVIAPQTTAQRLERYEDLELLANAGAISVESAGWSILEDLSRTLTAPQSASYPPQLSQFVLAGADWPLGVAPADAVERFESSVDGCGGLDATAREILRVRSACALRRLSEDVAAPEIASLAALTANPSEAADAALADWIRSFVLEPTLVFDTLAPRLSDGQRLPNVVREAVADAAAQWSPEQKAALLRAVAEAYRDGDLDDSALRETGIGDAEPDVAGEVLVDLYESSKNNDQRAQVMTLWRLVDPAPERVRRRLINKVYLPLLEEGKGATRIALDHFSLVRDPPSQALRQKLKSAIHDAAEGNRGLSKRADQLLRAAGWITSKRRWLLW